MVIFFLVQIVMTERHTDGNKAPSSSFVVQGDW